MTRSLLTFFSFALVLGYVFASAPAQDWENVVASLRNTLDVLQLSHEQYLAQPAPQHSKRDTTFRTGRAGYWRPLANRRRLDPSEGFSEQVNELVSSIEAYVQQLQELVASQFPPGGSSSGVIASSTPALSSIHPSILPITNLNTPPALPTSDTAATTSRSFVPDSPLYTSTAPSPSGTYTFNPRATDLNVVYYSQTDLTPVISLTQVCNDPSIDIVILAFVTHLVSNGGYPSMNMASNCWAPDAAQQAAGATALLDCVHDLSGKIAQCQQQGKKVMISLGGAYGDLTMSSDAQAAQVADTLWELFLSGTNATLAPLRPYGNVVLDGIDIDNELPSAATHLTALVRSLRQLMSTADKAYYLSAAPQCPRPDASISAPNTLPYIDFWSVQFYNNPSCNLGQTGQPTVPNEGFFTSLQNWSNDLQAQGNIPSGSRIKRTGSGTSFQTINNGITSPRLLIGTPAFAKAGSGYVDVATYKSILQRVKSMALPNLAGAMYWDGAYQEVSGQMVDGVNTTFAQVVKQVL
ncbi:hypothetical protein H2200_009573 [Cladophialophora chaetospira]|uniref:chitinase n=1 Tax=Cladophialophora chaetospira TaxID=386627 RepID=A0AA38X2S6_9EURO|nr:hypothetical protein H2200_009573 [Cladophialophora chaetospira]